MEGLFGERDRVSDEDPLGCDPVVLSDTHNELSLTFVFYYYYYYHCEDPLTDGFLHGPLTEGLDLLVVSVDPTTINFFFFFMCKSREWSLLQSQPIPISDSRFISREAH